VPLRDSREPTIGPVRRTISLLTDFGSRDPSAGIVRGVIVGIAPDVAVVDISHDVRKFAIRDGALLLWCALPSLPVGIHVAVVDPGVGTARRPIAVRAERGDILVGPDNGLLLGPIDRLGGVVDAIELANPRYRLPVVSTSFHGRDIFAPAAAWLGRGVPLSALGPRLDPSSLVPSPLPHPRVGEGRLETSVIYVDTFGNVKLSALAADLDRALGAVASETTLDLRIAGADHRVPFAGTFGDVAPGEPLLYVDSYGRLCIAVNQGDAAATLGLVEDAPVSVRRGPVGSRVHSARP
jgi:S-adenosylmethionine hydrolase